MEIQKPIPKIVQRLPIIVKHPEVATLVEIQSMAARLLDDQKNDPQPHEPGRPPRRICTKG